MFYEIRKPFLETITICIKIAEMRAKIKAEKTWRSFRVRRHFVTKPNPKPNPNPDLYLNQIKSFIIIAVIRQSV